MKPFTVAMTLVLSLMLTGTMPLPASGIIPMPLSKVVPQAHWIIQGRIRARETPRRYLIVLHVQPGAVLLAGTDKPLPPLTLTYSLYKQPGSTEESSDFMIESSILAVTGSGREFQAEVGKEYIFLIADRFLEEGKPATLLRIEPLKNKSRIQLGDGA